MSEPEASLELQSAQAGAVASPECEAVQAELSAYMDDQVTSGRRAAMAQHIAHCAACRAEFALLGLVSHSLRQMPRPEPSEAMRQRLLAEVGAELPLRRMEIFIRERHGDHEVQRREVRLYREPAPGVGLKPSAAPSLRMITQRRQQVTDRPNCYQVIEESYGRG